MPCKKKMEINDNADESPSPLLQLVSWVTDRLELFMRPNRTSSRFWPHRKGFLARLTGAADGAGEVEVDGAVRP